jgi:hypothetical protein
MLAKQLCNVLVVGLGTIAAVHFAAAREGGQGRGQGGGQGGGNGAAKEHGKHMHHHKSGHDMLGAKLKQDGKHAVGKFKDKTVTAEVKGGKVHNMTAGDMPAKRVRTKMKMASADGLIVPIALNLVQYEDYYYGYCFDDGIDYDCYWYPASDVDYVDYTWEDYDPYY